MILALICSKNNENLLLGHSDYKKVATRKKKFIDGMDVSISRC